MDNYKERLGDPNLDFGRMAKERHQLDQLVNKIKNQTPRGSTISPKNKIMKAFMRNLKFDLAQRTVTESEEPPSARC